MAINYQGGNDVVVTGAFAPFMKTLQQNYIYEQEKQEQIKKETNALKQQAQKEVSKINPNGLWKADLPEFNKNYEELKRLNFELNKTRDPYKAQELSMQLNEKALGLINFAQNSSETSKRYSTYLNGLPTLAGKGDVNKARTHAEQALSRPSSELGLDYFDKSQFMFKYDPTKVDSAVSKVASDLLKNVPEQRTLANTVTGSGGRRTDIWNVTKTANETQVLEQLSRLAKGGNRDVQSYVEDLMTNNNVDFNTAVGMLAEEFSPKFSTQSTSETSADKPKGITVNVDNRVMTPSEQISTRPLQIGKFSSPSSITRNEKGVLLSGNKEFYDPNTGQKIKVGRDNFQVDYTQDVRLGVDKNGNPVDENSPQAVGTQNFAVAQMVDPSASSIQANIPAYANIGKRTVLIPEGDRQLFGKSTTVKTDATRRSEQNTTNKKKTPAELMREARGNK